MPKTREIRGRIRAVSNIQRITKTMQMIATARFQAAQKRTLASQPYTRQILQMVRELSAVLSTRQEEGLSHPLLQAPQPPTGRKLLLVIASNRGLCGGYNANILRTAMEWISRQEGTDVDVEVVGKKAMAYFRFIRRPVAAFHGQFGDKPTYEQVEELAQRYIDEFSAGKYDGVHVASVAFISAGKQVPRVLDLLPLKPVASPKDVGWVGWYDFYPDARDLLEELLPLTVKVQLFQCFNEAVVSEHVARMVAMKSATDAATRMKKTLTLQYNRARQTAITTELMEVIGGAAGLGY